MSISNENILITDSGYWIALFNRSDRFHSAALNASKEYRGHEVAITQPVITEATHMLRRYGLADVIERFLGTIAGHFVHIWEPGRARLPRMIDLMHKYRSLPMDYADASLVLLAEHLGHGRILSTDLRDFGTYRWKNHYPFDNLLENHT